MAKNLTLTELVNDEKMEAAGKLTAISKKVERARTAYGNTEVEIDAPDVDTCEGKVNIKYLSDADKVFIAGREIANIRVNAIEAVKATEGAVLDREVERLLAVNPVLVSLLTKSESAYI